MHLWHFVRGFHIPFTNGYWSGALMLTLLSFDAEQVVKETIELLVIRHTETPKTL